MAIYMPPLARKKRVENRYNPDTFRVISHYAEETHPKYESEDTYIPPPHRIHGGLALPDIYNRKTEVLPKSAPDYRVHKPHPGSCGFLRHNVRLLNEPICSVYTSSTKEEQKNWWPSRVSDEPLHVPPKTVDTIYRVDFQPEGTEVNMGSQRHSANPNKEAAHGSVPVNFLRPKDNRQRLYQEKKSYEHQYNSRLDRNYSIRGKRQGHFVWEEMKPDVAQKFINRYKVISAEEGVAKQQAHEFQKSLMKMEPVTTGQPQETSVPEPQPPETSQPPDPELTQPLVPETSAFDEPKQSSPQQSPKHIAEAVPSSPKTTFPPTVTVVDQENRETATAQEISSGPGTQN